MGRIPRGIIGSVNDGGLYNTATRHKGAILKKRDDGNLVPLYTTERYYDSKETAWEVIQMLVEAALIVEMSHV